MNLLVQYVYDFLKTKNDDEKSHIISCARLTEDQSNTLNEWIRKDEPTATLKEREPIYRLYFYLTQI